LSAALVSAVAGSKPVTTRDDAAQANSAGVMLFIVGSRARKSGEQAAALRAAGAVTLEAPNGEISAHALEEAARRLPARGSLLVLATQPDGEAASAEVVAQRLAQLCTRVLKQCKVRAVVATGGDTAKAVLEISGNPVVDVRDELMPGIALARFKVIGQEYQFVTKAGGFGQVDTFTSIENALK
jgi:4-hydroxythreonine-4-phosphate dehydrogenase